MGREIRRVPLDFSWPLNKPWDGFVNPHYTAVRCDPCDGTGYGEVAKRLHDQWYGNAPFTPSETGSTPFPPTHPTIVWRAKRNAHEASWIRAGSESVRLAALYNGAWSHHLDADDVAALIAEDRLWDFTRVPRTDEQREVVRAKVAAGGNNWLPENSGYIPTPAEVNEWSISGMGHDSINCMVCIQAKCKRLGVESSCPVCNGEGDVWPSKEAEKLYDDWQSTDPPAGEGYQLWETVSEGSPISPVMATPEKLARWLTDYGRDREETYEEWLAFITGPGWGMSMVVENGIAMSGVEAAAKHAAEES